MVSPKLSAPVGADGEDVTFNAAIALSGSIIALNVVGTVVEWAVVIGVEGEAVVAAGLGRACSGEGFHGPCVGQCAGCERAEKDEGAGEHGYR